LDSPYPVVDGKFSNVCYLRSLDTCYQGLLRKLAQQTSKVYSLDDFNFVLFHAPYNKLVQKSFARLVYNDCLRHPARPGFESLKSFLHVPTEQSYEDRNLEQAFVAASAPLYKQKVVPSILLPTHIGNTYTASLYMGLASCLFNLNEQLAGARLLLFSYGSGLASSLFSLRVATSESGKAALKRMCGVLNLSNRLQARVRTSPSDFSKAMDVRESLHNRPMGFIPSFPVENFLPGTFYLTKNDQGRRSYEQIPFS